MVKSVFKRAFGVAGGKHSRKKQSSWSPTWKHLICVQVSDLKVKIRNKSSLTMDKKKVTKPLLTSTHSVHYKVTPISKLKFSIKKKTVSGYRMINVRSMEQMMGKMMRHYTTCPGATTESDSPCTVVREITKGVATVLYVECNGCKSQFTFETSPKTGTRFDVNVRAVWGSIVCGNGAAHLAETMATMDSPSLSASTFSSIEQEIGNEWEFLCQEELLAAGAEERRIAIEKGNFHQGIPAITVVADGGWSKRSHKHTYNALGGVAIIIGQETGKVVYIGVRNKHCYICNRSANRHEQPPDHVCYQNWGRSSQAMEADIIVEGFNKAEKMHGLRYMWLVGDGDSSVYAKIQEEVPVWGLDVKKVECANHICKNLRSNLEKLVESNPQYKGKNNLTKATRIRIVSAVRCAVRMRSKEPDKRKSAKVLAHDIRNSIHHIFGNHQNCSDFCKARDTSSQPNPVTDNTEVQPPDSAADICTESASQWLEGSSIECQENSRHGCNHAPSDIDSAILKDVGLLLDRVANKSDRLIHNSTTNMAEAWMHVRTKLDGGKVYNLCNRGSWHTRCYGGMLRTNIGPEWCPTVWEQVHGLPAGDQFKQLYAARKKRLQTCTASKRRPEARKNRWKRKMQTSQQNATKAAKQSYGPKALDVTPDISTEQLNSKKQEFVENHINISPERISAINSLTTSQSNSQVWHDERRKRITASKFGPVLRRNPSIPVCKLVQQMLYSNFKGTQHTRNGIQQERITTQEYILKKAEEGINVVVEPSGLHISKEHSFLGASPDGIILENGAKCGLLEVKNVLLNKAINLLQAAKQQKNFCLTEKEGCLSLKKTHDYYYQCQGLMLVCELPWVDFVVRCTNPYQLHVQRIVKDETACQQWVLKLNAFYFKVLLPELCSPRHGKVPGIREPG